ncbi:DUF397 domain-containing protein [Streptomyces filamentosus]|uniref:Toxin n=1 Tax=Streptomyces filamentosus TaxID=67294 RepID=A0A919BJE0_STRFL|nr:DUF397 domain-containing protein [Streptomyces filamentosus]GHF91503.1 toxin [Streptomyces filamentosus]
MIRNTPAGAASELAWFKSSYSGGNDGESCIEVAWHKSSHSSSSEGDSCVEVGSCATTVHVRDSKCLDGPQLDLAPGAWTSFVSYASDARV